MKIADIYHKFSIPPNLQQHMLRVAALAGLIVDGWKANEGVRKKLVVDSCLLHDLGNIIKFDFANFPELLNEEQKNIEYWKEVKQKTIQKYGAEEDIATSKMLKELHAPQELIFMVENWGFKNFNRIAASDNWNWKIAVYADHRIGPAGVVTLKQNLENKQQRYRLSKPNASHISDQAGELFRSAEIVEQQIKVMTSLNLDRVTTAEVDGLAKDLSKTDL